MSGRPVSLVTGAARGIGRAVAVELAARGFDLIVWDREPLDREVIAELAERGAACSWQEVDVGDADAITTAFAEGRDHHPLLTTLVNCAGIAQARPVLDISPQDFERMLRINLLGSFFTSQAFAKNLVERGLPGSIVNITSMAARTGGKYNGAHYAASKAGLIAVTQAMATALGRHGIRVNAVAPGIIETDMTRAIEGSGVQAMASPLGRWGRPREVATTIAFLVSEDASYITGEVVDINGGLL
jgi:3-oxoacyl-[acyl-carrier protein] reductase